MLNEFESFMKKVDQSASCWIWNGGVINNYAIFYYDGTRVLGHKWIYELATGDCTSKRLMHTCGVKICVNPDHLTKFKYPEREKCLRGHFYDTIWAGKKRCRYCYNMNSRKRYYLRVQTSRLGKCHERPELTNFEHPAC